jgi:uncharacterized membrane protein (DUF4010 family)
MIDQIGLSTIFAVALLSGLADLDAITLSTARMVGSELTAEVAMIAIFLAAAANLTAKMVLAILFGSRAYALALSMTTLTALVIGTVAYFGVRAFT